MDDSGKPSLKKSHPFGYCTQIQLAMGMSGLQWCHFIVYTYKGVIIIKENFDNYFKAVVKKCKEFYEKYLLPFYLSESSTLRNTV